MEKKYLEQFISLFDALYSASSLLIDEKKPPFDFEDKDLNKLFSKVKKNSIEYVKKACKKADAIFMEPDMTGLLRNVLNEIELNLYSSTLENRIIYLKSILIEFFNISPYVDPNVKLDKQSIHYNNYKAALFPIIKLIRDDRLSYDDFSVPERYIIFCHELVDIFFCYLDVKCLILGIDLMAIQKEMNISVYIKRDTNFLYGKGFENIIKQFTAKQFEINKNNNQSEFKKSKKDVTKETLNLRKIFYDNSEYDFVMKLLTKHKFIDPDTYRWVDKEKSNNGTVVYLVDYLSSKGYYPTLSLNDKKELILNTFGLDISMSTIKQYKEPKPNPFIFIPASPTYLEKIR